MNNSKIIQVANAVLKGNKFGIGFFGDPAYAFEELIAELAAAMTCQRFGIECTAENSKAYIAGWSTCCEKHLDALRKAAEISSKIADVFCNFVKPKAA